MKLKANELRESSPTKSQINKFKRNPLVFILDGILDTYNVGSMFRLADALAVEKLYLCGKMETPPNHRIHKAAVGTENWVPWEYFDSTVDCVKRLKSDGYQIVTIEQSQNSINYKDLKPDFPVALVLGHETTGVNPEVIKLSDQAVELPMHGINNSFNVWGTAAVVGYEILPKIKGAN